MTATVIPSHIDEIIQTLAGALHSRCGSDTEHEDVDADVTVLRSYIEELIGKLKGANATWRTAQAKLDVIRATAVQLQSFGDADAAGQIMYDTGADLLKILDSDD